MELCPLRYASTAEVTAATRRLRPPRAASHPCYERLSGPPQRSRAIETERPVAPLQRASSTVAPFQSASTHGRGNRRNTTSHSSGTSISQSTISICQRLPPVATSGLHKGSIIISCLHWLREEHEQASRPTPRWRRSPPRHRTSLPSKALLRNECLPNRCSCPSVRAVNRWNLLHVRCSAISSSDIRFPSIALIFTRHM
jgi:hypothetical protein